MALNMAALNLGILDHELSFVLDTERSDLGRPSPQRANATNSDHPQGMQQLMRSFEFRLVARVEEVLERNFVRFSDMLLNRERIEVPDAGRQILPHQQATEHIQGDPGGSEHKGPLATSPPSGPKSERSRLFEKLDTTHDGGISRQEWAAGVKADELLAEGQGGCRKMLAKGGAEDLETTQEVFDRLDTNHDGLVSQTEWDAGVEAERALAKKKGRSLKTLFTRHKKKVHLGHQIEAEDMLQLVVQSLWFQVLVIFVILLQSAHLGWEANESLQLEIEFLEGDRSNTDLPSHFGLTSIVFHCFFALEILLRICAWRAKFFKMSDQEFFFWNVFDLAMILGMALEVLDIDIEMLRAVRLLRVTRVLRILRVFPKLRKMVYALLHSMQSLFWLVIMLTVTLYIFSLSFMQGSLQYLHKKTPEEFQAHKTADFAEMRGTFIIMKRFGNIGIAMRSLFAAITGGDPWDWLFEPIMEMSWAYSVVAIFFVVFFIFAVMNVVTGVFVDEAMKISQIDKDIMIQDIRAEDLLMKKDMEQLVKSLDEDGDGTLGVTELKSMLEKDEVQRWLQGCDIDLSLGNLDQILDVLDHDRTGRVNPNDFFGILSSIKGQARSVDVFLLHHELQLQANDLHRLMQAQPMLK